MNFRADDVSETTPMTLVKFPGCRRRRWRSLPDVADDAGEASRMSPMTLGSLPDVADDVGEVSRMSPMTLRLLVLDGLLLCFLPGKRFSLFNYGFCASNMLSDVRKHRG